MLHQTLSTDKRRLFQAQSAPCYSSETCYHPPHAHHLLLHSLVDVAVVAGEQFLHELEVLWTELVLLVHEQDVLPPDTPLNGQWHFDLGGC